MEAIEFTEEEKRFISSYIRRHSRWFDTVFHYGAYILPSLLFAIYAIWKGDFVAAVVAYGALFIVAILYLSYSSRYAHILRSILVKYDSIYPKKHSEQSL